MKICNKCKKEQSLENFGKNQTTKDGYNLKCKSCYKEYAKEYNEKNKDQIASYHSEYNKNNPNQDYRKNYRIKTNNLHTKKWTENNKNKILEYHRGYYQLNKHITKWRDLIHLTIKEFNTPKLDSTINLLKYSALDLKEHLDSLGMDWKLDHVDHKIPLSWFNHDAPAYIVNDLRNLQPLKAELNKIKSNKFSHIVSKDYYDLIYNYVKIEYKPLIKYNNV